MSIETSPVAGEALPVGGDPVPAKPGSKTSGAQKTATPKSSGGKAIKEEGPGDEGKSLYPWGNKEPARRVMELEKAFQLFDKRRKEETKAWAARQAQFVSEERQIKGDLKLARGILEKSRREAAARNVAQSVERLLASGKIDESLLTDEGGLEKLILKALGAKA